MTYFAHKALKKNAKESDISYVVYELRKSEKYPGRSNLYRGSFPRVPEDFKEKPTMFLFADNIESISYEAWNGDDWARDGWDSTNSTTKDILPKMVRIRIRAWSESPITASEDSDDNAPLDQLATLVYLSHAIDFNELKQRNSSFRLQ